MAWNDLSMKERAELIKLGVSNGLRDIGSIRDFYNEYADGGQKGNISKEYSPLVKNTEGYLVRGDTPNKNEYITNVKKYYNDFIFKVAKEVEYD